MFKLFKKKEVNLYSPINGKVIAIEEVSDNVFSSKMMGEGVAFILEDETICAPCDGEISLIPPTFHAFGMKTDNDMEILIHVGLDTVNLNGKGFKMLVNPGTKVKRGTPILKVDLEFMNNHAIDLTTPMIITNSSDYDITIENKNTYVSKESPVVRCIKK